MKILSERAESLNTRFQSVSESSKKLEERVASQMKKLEEDFSNMSVKTLLEASDKSIEEYVDLATESQALQELQEEIEQREKALMAKSKSIDGLSEEEKGKVSREVFKEQIQLMVLVSQFNERVEKYNSTIARLREEKEPNKQVNEDASH